MAICDIIASELGELFSCSNINGYVRVRTPFLYPDGDVIDLFVQEEDDTFTISDLGETMRWLRAQSLSAQRSPKQRQLIEDVRITHGLEFFKGMLQARVKKGQAFAAVAVRVAQGALRMSDLWFTMRTRSFESVTDEVALYLSEKKIAFERSQQIAGRSGRTWRPDFHTRTTRQSSLVFILSTGSRAAAHRVSEHVLAAWVDLNALKIGPESVKFVSLFDDTMDVWSPQDFNLLESLSDVARWSQPDDFAEILAA